MKKYGISLAVLAGLLVACAAAWAQTPAPGGTATQGFTVEALISQLSLYLPEESTQGLGGFGGRGFGGGQGAGGQAGNAQAGGGQAGNQSAAGQAGSGQGFRQLFQYKRDPKMYLTKDQIVKLLPILVGLKENPLPTPSKAKQVQAGVDAILTVAQKAEYVDFQKQMQKAIEEIRKQFAANGTNGGNGPTFLGAGEAGQGQGAQAGQQRSGQGAQLTPTERRQRELDAFIKVLQDRQKQISA